MRTVINLIKALRAQKPGCVKYIRCNNAGENKTLEKKMQDKGLGVTFKYTAQNTPQQNGKVERTFATLYSRMRAMMEAAGFEYDQQIELWREAASTATKLSNVMVTKSTKKSPHERFFGIKPNILDNQRTFRELGVVTTNPGSTIKGKIED